MHSERPKLYAILAFLSAIGLTGQNRPDTPKMTNGLIQHITVEESTNIQWVKGKHLLLGKQFAFQTDSYRKKAKMKLAYLLPQKVYPFTQKYVNKYLKYI